MKKYFLLTVLCISLISCTSEKQEDNQQVANLKTQSCSDINFAASCSGPTLYDNTPFNTTQTGDWPEGWYYGTNTCDSPASECFGLLLRRYMIREFAKHTNNIGCGLKGAACPSSGYSLVECYTAVTVDLSSTFGVDPSDDIQISEANYIYQEFMCRLLDENDTSDTEYIVIENMYLDPCLCGGGDMELFYDISVYRED